MMKLKALWAYFVCIFCMAPALLAADDVYWAYEGAFGPENWSQLSLDFEACNAGEQQSPIDLDGAIETYLAPVELHWKESFWELLNNGHTISASPEDGGFAMIASQRYELVNIHLHNPSEHHISGTAYPMEAHFVHRGKDESLAVIAVMIKGGGTNALFDGFMAKAPVKSGAKSMLDEFNPTGLITDPADQLRYQGSLTTPPCTQNVIWTVLTDPLVVSDAALLAFSTLFPNNARPLQSVNRRYILTD